VFFRFPDLETLRRTMADIERHVTVRVRPAERQGADA
jgi:hypothetical protein